MLLLSYLNIKRNLFGIWFHYNGLAGFLRNYLVRSSLDTQFTSCLI